MRQYWERTRSRARSAGPLKIIAGVGCATALAAAAAMPAAQAAQARPNALGGHLTPASATARMQVNCAEPNYSNAPGVQCPDVYDPIHAFGHYVGHDEPGVWFHSSVPGSGNRARWQLTLPTDPPPSSVPGQHIYSFEQHIAFWFGMALCANQSYPEQISTCTPDSDSNIVDPKVSSQHAGSAYLELQFYPPGSAPLPSWISCDATHWCAAMNVWTFYENPVTGQDLNAACQAKVGGVELDNFAFISHDGKPAGPPNPLDSDAATFTPNSDTLLMSQGDHIGVTIKDSPQGLTVRLADHTSGRTGKMVASAANGFGQMVFAPDPSTECAVTPYTFHPMYSTSSIETRATWTAFPYNIAWSDETGHFQYCSQSDPATGACTGEEGAPGAQEPPDADDFACFPASLATRDPIGGCVASNYGFDGPPYQDDWPNGSQNRPTPILFSSPLTGKHFNINYSRNALVAPLPFDEFDGGNQPCDIFARTGCTQLPVTDDGTPAAFYPYFYTTHLHGCMWGEGHDVPGLTVNDFGKLNQYGTYDPGVFYTTPSGSETFSSVFMQEFPRNECPATAQRGQRRGHH
ncbi:MAG TPA: hypothetical protein VFQ44_21280 [Streptosporangiaceae bacterium]|nr:hypothetical protein [Streptosporangiaceae bacterium]